MLSQENLFVDHSLQNAVQIELPEKNELIEKRTAHSAWYQWEDGRVVTQTCSRPIHYWSGRQWEKISNQYHLIDGDLIFGDQPIPYRFIKKQWILSKRNV
jgi:hypothetical protein